MAWLATGMARWVQITVHNDDLHSDNLSIADEMTFETAEDLQIEVRHGDTVSNGRDRSRIPGPVPGRSDEIEVTLTFRAVPQEDGRPAWRLTQRNPGPPGSVFVM
jgi:hypothetical protein